MKLVFVCVVIGPVPVCLSVCLSVMFVHCAQTAEDISKICFAYDSPTSLPDRVKISSFSRYIGQPLPSQIVPQSYQPNVDLSVRDIRRLIAAE